MQTRQRSESSGQKLLETRSRQIKDPRVGRVVITGVPREQHIADAVWDCPAQLVQSEA